MEMTGISQKQIRYGQSIYDNIKKQYPDVDLPEITNSQFWISAKDSSIEELLRRATVVIDSPNYVSTLFSSHHPRYNRQDAMNALNLLDLERAIVLDSETTGIKKGSEIIELSIVRYHDTETLFSSLIQPHRWQEYGTSKSTKKAAEVNQISSEQLEHAPTLLEVWNDITNILSTHQIIAFNVAFDLPMLQRSALVWSLEMPKLYATCAMLIFQAYMNSPDLFSLQEACDMFNIDRSQWGKTHLSLPDVYATIAIIKCMLNEEEPDLNIVSPFFHGEMLPVTEELVTPVSFADRLKRRR